LTVALGHLHVRSGFSYGFGTSTPEELVEATESMGAGSVALTDRDGLYGIPRFLRAAGEAGVGPVVGAEVSVDGGGHLVLLAEDAKGYRSLSKLVTFYRCSSEDRRKPLCTLPALLDHAEGLVCLTGAVPFGLLPRLVLSEDGRRAKEVLDRLLEAFGRKNVFVELTDDRTMGSRRRLGRLALFAEEREVPVLATNEVTYLRPEDHRLHEALVAAADLARLPGRAYRATDQLYLKAPEKMWRIFVDYPEALKNAAAVAERCAGAVRLTGKTHMPSVLLPERETTKKRLVRLILEGARKRYGKPDGKVRSRLRRELKCIGALGFASYFLLAHEAKEVAQEKGIPVTGRGSAANSLVSYCLGLTQPEPFSNRLLFERFLHEHRADPPDIDLDLCSERRDEVRDEMIRRYDRQ
jgi:error-prone DNA polymerase